MKKLFKSAFIYLFGAFLFTIPTFTSYIPAIFKLFKPLGMHLSVQISSFFLCGCLDLEHSFTLSTWQVQAHNHHNHHSICEDLSDTSTYKQLSLSFFPRGVYFYLKTYKPLKQLMYLLILSFPLNGKPLDSRDCNLFISCSLAPSPVLRP